MAAFSILGFYKKVSHSDRLDADWLVPSHHGLRLHEAAPDHSEFVRVPNSGHFLIWYDPDGDVAENTRDWFDRWLAPPKHQRQPVQ